MTDKNDKEAAERNIDQLIDSVKRSFGHILEKCGREGPCLKTLYLGLHNIYLKIRQQQEQEKKNPNESDFDRAVRLSYEKEQK